MSRRTSLFHMGARKIVIAIVAIATFASAGSFALTHAGAGAAIERDESRGYYESHIYGDGRWFGPYQATINGQKTEAWCVDHGNMIAPDTAYNYANNGYNTNYSGEPIDARTQRAMAWAAAYWGGYNHWPNAEYRRNVGAALTMVFHDFAKARYGGRVLNVDEVQVSDMSGFGGQAQNVLFFARWIKQNSLAHADLVPGFAMELTSTQPAPGQDGVVTARVHDANNVGVQDIKLTMYKSDGVTLKSETTQSTNNDGVATWNFTNNAGGDHEVHFHAFTDAFLPDGPVKIYSPVSPSPQAQRVAVPGLAWIGKELTFSTKGERTLTVKKTGDKQAYWSIAGAKFEVRNEQGQLVKDVNGNDAILTSNDDGSSNVVTLAPGVYKVVETQAPERYRIDTAEQTVDLTQPGPTKVVTFNDIAHKGVLVIKKQDKITSELIGGVHFKIGYDTNNDGTCDETFKDDVVTVAGEPLRFVDVEAGTYCITETKAAPGYVIDTTEHKLLVKAGEECTIKIDNMPETEVKGLKIDGNTNKPLPGAVFDLYRQDDGNNDSNDGTQAGTVATNKNNGSTTSTTNANDNDNANNGKPDDAKDIAGYTWVGRATSDDKGEMNFGSQQSGFVYCLSEVTAPEGYLPIDGLTCSDSALKAGEPIVITVKDYPYAHILGFKFDVATKAPLANATFDLYRQLGEGEEATAPEDMPADAKAFEGYVWVARAASDSEGNLDFGAYAPGSKYCAYEQATPTGYEQNTTLQCMENPMGNEDVTLQLPNTALPVVLGETITQPTQVLARTGSSTTGPLVFIGLTLVGLGAAAIALARRFRPRWLTR